VALILNIDTATEFASVCISNGNEIIAYEENLEQKSHASFLQAAVKKMFDECEFVLNDLDAIAVTNGPGSYTGLRVGLSSAKGLCFALGKPLILLNTLDVMALASIVELGINSSNLKPQTSNFLFCPMIDARRMEAFTAVYDKELSNIIAPRAMILDSQSFADELAKNKIIFSGSGSSKLAELTFGDNAIISNVQYSAKNMIQLSLAKYQKKDFADLAYSTPDYHKEFYTPMGKKH
jgi:tRNA threonylcarbamoyladenosine biosynthesis protein TsaB